MPVRPTFTSMREQLCGGLRGRELVGDGPARLAADGAHLPLEREVIDLDDDAVDLVVERVALLDPALAERGDLVERLEALDVGVDAEAELLQPLQDVPVRLRLAAAVVPAELVPEGIERARGGDLRVELADGAGGGVARAGEERESGGAALDVELLEAALRHVDLAADLESIREIGRGEAARDGADGA